MGLFGFGKKKDEPEAAASSGVADVLKDLLEDWVAGGQPPAVPMEGCGPAFAHALSSTPRDFTFDSFIQQERPEWMWRPLTFPDYFDGPFALYQPTVWSDVRQKGPLATVGDEIAVRQSVYLLDRETWHAQLPRFLEKHVVGAWAYYPLRLPGYVQWVIGTLPPGPGDDFWVYGVFSSGETLIVIKGNARDEASLREQLTSVTTSCPWVGWIRAASAMDA